MDGTETSGSTGWLSPPKGHPANPSWTYRRIVIYVSLVFNVAALTSILVGWFLGKADDVSIQIVAGGSIAQSTAIIGSYVFGAAFENVNIMKWFSGSNMMNMFSTTKDCDKENTRTI